MNNDHRGGCDSSLRNISNPLSPPLILPLGLKTEYKAHECIYCGSINTRIKQKKDWHKGEVMARGHFPKIFNYYICDNCKKTFISFKEISDGITCRTKKK